MYLKELRLVKKKGVFQFEYKPTKIKALDFNEHDNIERTIRKILPKKEMPGQEKFVLIYLNTDRKAFAFYRLAAGTELDVPVDMRNLSSSIAHSRAAGFVTVHNHPDNDLRPSDEDVDLFHSISLVATLMNVEYTDNIIIGPKRIFHFMENLPL